MTEILDTISITSLHPSNLFFSILILYPQIPALKATLSSKPNGVENWKTAVFYQLLHSVAILSLSTIDSRKAFQKKESSHLSSSSSWSGGKIMAVGTAMF